MAYTVELDGKSGPLKALLQMVEEKQLSVQEVQVAQIGAQYWVAPADLEASSEFMVLLATLLYLKASRLLPGPQQAQELPTLSSEEGGEAPAALLSRVERYRQYRQAAVYLGEREEPGRGRYYRLAADDPWWEEYARKQALAGITVGELVQAWERVLRRQAVLAARSGPPARVARRPRVTLVRRMAEIRKKLRECPQGCPFVLLLDNAASREEMVVTFLALLELCRLGVVSLVQQEPFSSITALPAERRYACGQGSG